MICPSAWPRGWWSEPAECSRNVLLINVQDLADLAPIDQTLEKEHHERTKVKNIQVIELGRYEVRALPSLTPVCSSVGLDDFQGYRI